MASLTCPKHNSSGNGCCPFHYFKLGTSRNYNVGGEDVEIF
jgi:hypothetical protein